MGYADELQDQAFHKLKGVRRGMIRFVSHSCFALSDTQLGLAALLCRCHHTLTKLKQRCSVISRYDSSAYVRRPAPCQHSRSSAHLLSTAYCMASCSSAFASAWWYVSLHRTTTLPTEIASIRTLQSLCFVVACRGCRVLHPAPVHLIPSSSSTSTHSTTR